MSLSLFRRPGSIIFLDDDREYLEMLKMLLPVQWHVLLHLSAKQVIEHVATDAPAWERDLWRQQEMVRCALQDTLDRPYALLPQILDYWASSPDRYAITSTVVTDYSMPEMDGLELLASLGRWDGARVLLTGQGDDQIAVAAFNRGLIDLYLRKESGDLLKGMVPSVRQVSMQALPRHENLWETLLSPLQQQVLRDPAICGALVEFTEKCFAEHVVLGRPFGILGLTPLGVPQWLQLEPVESLELAALAAADKGLPASVVAAVRAGQQLTAVEAGVTLPPDKLVADAVNFGERGQLKGALFELGPALPQGGYSQWRARQPARTIVR